MDQLNRNTVIADGEVLERTLSLRPPEGLSWHLDWPHAVVFGPSGLGHDFASGRSTSTMMSSIPLTLTTT